MEVDFQQDVQKIIDAAGDEPQVVVLQGRLGYLYRSTFASCDNVLHLYNLDRETLVGQVRRAGDHVNTVEFAAGLVKQLHEVHANYTNMSQSNSTARDRLREMGRNVEHINTALNEWAEDNVNDVDEWNELMESLNLEPLEQKFTVRVIVSYEVDVEVKARSSEDAERKCADDEDDIVTDEVVNKTSHPDEIDVRYAEVV